MIPAAPKPATALPKISISELCAAQQMVDPPMKMVKRVRNRTFEFKCAYMVPVRGCNVAQTS